MFTSMIMTHNSNPMLFRRHRIHYCSERKGIIISLTVRNFGGASLVFLWYFYLRIDDSPNWLFKSKKRHLRECLPHFDVSGHNRLAGYELGYLLSGTTIFELMRMTGNDCESGKIMDSHQTHVELMFEFICSSEEFLW